MARDITLSSILPQLATENLNKLNDLSQKTFIGIDFGTSTTVVSIAQFDARKRVLTAEPIWLNQKLVDGSVFSSEKVPTVIAWFKDNILVGEGASDLKYSLKLGENIWYSFKMELGEDLGAKYYNSQLGRDSKFQILNPKDATRVFFQYLKAQINRHIQGKGLSPDINYAVSIPASFEANQRQELIDAMVANEMRIDKQALIDEPNAAFLSYVQDNSAHTPLRIPDGDNPKALVFDFGAGTCDVSILELGSDLNGVYSKNLSISKFEKLGGDNIDMLIARKHLLPVLLSSEGFEESDFRSNEIDRIVGRLLKTAEQLKILVCQNVSLQMEGRLLPRMASSLEKVSLGVSLKIDTRKGELVIDEPSISYSEFESLIAGLVETRGLVDSAEVHKQECGSIFNPIRSALRKANLTKVDVDYVLLIGGSSKNPYVQDALKRFFEDSDLIVPRDLQTHVSAGASIHSLVFNGLGKNIIHPITSEPILVVTRDETSRVLLRAGTQIPSDVLIIDDLFTNEEGQEAIELPICLGNLRKLLFNIKIFPGDIKGFAKGTPVRLEIQITADKLLRVQASIQGQSVQVEPINPFANRELSDEERSVLKAERQANLDAAQNGGVPSESALRALINAYKVAGHNFKAAETLEILNDYYPDEGNYNNMSVLYGAAGHHKKSRDFAKKAFEARPGAVTAFNYALEMETIDLEIYKQLLRRSIEFDRNYALPRFELGRHLVNNGESEEGQDLMQQAFEIFKAEFESGEMKGNTYGWFASCSRKLGLTNYAEHIENTRPLETIDRGYNLENLTVSKVSNNLMKQ
jgi:molecular chaperone DnaK